MAVVNEILAGRYNQQLTRKYGITGGAPAPQLGMEVMPVAQLSREEADLILGGEVMCGASVGSIAGVALKKAAVRLRNPAGSNVAATIERIFCSTVGSADAVDITFQYVNTDFANLPAAPGPMIRDTRATQSAAGAFPHPPACVLSFDNSPPGTISFGIGAISLGAAFPLVISAPIAVLGPGSVMDILQEVANTDFRCSIWWRERPIIASELGPF